MNNTTDRTKRFMLTFPQNGSRYRQQDLFRSRPDIRNATPYQQKPGRQTTSGHQIIQTRNDLEQDLMQIAVAESMHVENMRKKEADDIEKAIKESAETKEPPTNSNLVRQLPTTMDLLQMTVSTIQFPSVNQESSDLHQHIKTIVDAEIDEQKKLEPSNDEMANTPMVIDELAKNDPVTLNQTTVPPFAPHYDFIVGRGKNAPNHYMNFPLNPNLQKRNIVYIDPNPAMDADIRQMLDEVDFRSFGICKDQDPKEEINIRFFFDWSSFYCGAIQSLTKVILGIGRKCQIFVPLSKDEQTIPSDVKFRLSSNIFTLALVEGRYPMFDWNEHNDPVIHAKPSMRNVMNPDRYIRIDTYLDL
jgi:hypothetical protein